MEGWHGWGGCRILHERRKMKREEREMVMRLGEMGKKDDWLVSALGSADKGIYYESEV